MGTFKFEYPENCEYPENIWDIKFEFLNILKDIEVSWTLSQCHKVVYTENPEYPEKYSVQYSVLSPNINILVNIQKTSSSGPSGVNLLSQSIYILMCVLFQLRISIINNVIII